ncbi:MAG: FapA family protein [Gammaproteobacteria bacterium]|nr:FapA family protein [Gammaproteobacteria bacterium]
MNAPPPKSELGITFSANKDGSRIIASLDPLNGKKLPTLKTLKDEIALQGFGDAEIPDSGLAELLKQWEKATQSFALEVGSIADAVVSIDISKNKLEAYLTIEKAKGGQRVTLEDVLDKMKREGLKYGVIAEAVKKAVAAGEANHEVIAKGHGPVHGERAKFIVLIKEAADRRPNVKEDGSVNYRDILNISTVKEGEPLMRRMPATRGVKGKDVKGRELVAKDGKDVPYSSRLKNVKFSEDDKNILVAAMAGQPVIETDGMSVDPTLSVDKVDISTGNLEFDGTVIIRGDVLTGMQVKVTGEVHIGGMVEASRVEAGGDIIIAGGVIGRGEVRDDEGKQNESAAVLMSNGQIQARFVENALVKSAKDVIIKDLVSHSEVLAEGRVIIGGKGATKGQIIGGIVEGYGGVEAINMGTAGGVSTKIRIGAPLAPLKEKQKSVEEKIHLNTIKLKQLQAALVQLMQKQPPDEVTIKKAQATEAILEADALDFATQLNDVNMAIKRLTMAKAIAKQHLYGGVELTFLDKSRLIKDDQGPSQFQYENGMIIKK